MGRGAQRFAFACASTSQEPSRSSCEYSPPPRPLYALLRLYRRQPGLALSGSSAFPERSRAMSLATSVLRVLRSHLRHHRWRYASMLACAFWRSRIPRSVEILPSIFERDRLATEPALPAPRALAYSAASSTSCHTMRPLGRDPANRSSCLRWSPDPRGLHSSGTTPAPPRAPVPAPPCVTLRPTARAVVPSRRPLRPAECPSSVRRMVTGLTRTRIESLDVVPGAGQAPNISESRRGPQKRTWWFSAGG